MTTTMILLSLILAPIIAAATASATAAPVTAPQIANSIAIPGCVEPACVIIATSAAASFQFGVGATWCATLVIAPKLPLVVNYGSPSPTLTLCSADPAQGVIKGLVALEQTATYTVTYTIAGKPQPIFTVPALPAPPVHPPAPPAPPVIITTRSCTGTLTTDSAGNDALNLTCK